MRRRSENAIKTSDNSTKDKVKIENGINTPEVAELPDGDNSNKDEVTIENGIETSEDRERHRYS